MQNEKKINTFVFIGNDLVKTFDYGNIEAYEIYKVEEQKMRQHVQFTKECIDLNNQFILVKKCSGKYYFFKSVGRNAVTNPRYGAKIFIGKEDAEKGLADANRDRKKYKYKLYPAGQFLKSEWVMNADWNGNVRVFNRLENIRNKNFVNYDEILCKSMKENTLKRMKEQLIVEEKQLKSLQEEVNSQTENVRQRANLLKEVEEFNLKEFIDKNTTESEKTAAILYGK